MAKAWTAPVVMLLLACAAIVATLDVQGRSDAARAAQLTLARTETQLDRLQNLPFRASPTTGGSPVAAGLQMREVKRRIVASLDALRGSPEAPASLRAVADPLRANFARLDDIYAIGASGAAYGPAADRLAARAALSMDATMRMLDAASRRYDARADRTRREAATGGAAVILALFAAFTFAYRRAARSRCAAEELALQNARLLETSRGEARCDALTGLPNRRALLQDLPAELGAASGERPLFLALFDLDGFKNYNDTFGHLAGDAVLARLAGQLSAAVGGEAVAYRMGGDEFCVVGGAGADGGERLSARAAAALSLEGDGFAIGCSYGLAHVPAETRSASEALRMADQRMYARKRGARGRWPSAA